MHTVCDFRKQQLLFYIIFRFNNFNLIAVICLSISPLLAIDMENFELALKNSSDNHLIGYIKINNV